MIDAFRSQHAALVERVAQLEAENRELRARLNEIAEEIAARGENREAFVKRLGEENRELHAQVAELREELARDRLRAERDPTKSHYRLGDWLEDLARLFRRD